jgi:hypothetical protein
LQSEVKVTAGAAAVFSLLVLVLVMIALFVAVIGTPIGLVCFTCWLIWKAITTPRRPRPASMQVGKR